MDLKTELGNIDIYLLDQVMKGRIPPGARILDAGCGPGRNLVHFLRTGCQVSGVDESPEAIVAVRALAEQLVPGGDPERFTVASLESLPHPDRSQDAVIVNAVLHFARDESHFRTMLDQAWRVLVPGGLFFARLASSIGLEGRLVPRGGRRYGLPDGTDRFLVDLEMLLAETERLGAEQLEPIKTVDVQGKRAMTTWVLRKPLTC
jgi:tellurite methyltransferase